MKRNVSFTLSSRSDAYVCLLKKISASNCCQIVLPYFSRISSSMFLLSLFLLKKSVWHIVRANLRAPQFLKIERYAQRLSRKVFMGDRSHNQGIMAPDGT